MEYPESGRFLLPICVSRRELLLLISAAQFYEINEWQNGENGAITSLIFQAMNYVNEPELSSCYDPKIVEIIKETIKIETERITTMSCVICGCSCSGSSACNCQANTENLKGLKSNANAFDPYASSEADSPSVNVNSSGAQFNCAAIDPFVDFIVDQLDEFSAGVRNANLLVDSWQDFLVNVVESIPALGDGLANVIGWIVDLDDTVFEAFEEVLTNSEYVERLKVAMARIIGDSTDIVVTRQMLNSWARNTPLVWGQNLVPVQGIVASWAYAVDVNFLQQRLNILANSGNTGLCDQIRGLADLPPYDNTIKLVPAAPAGYEWEYLEQQPYEAGETQASFVIPHNDNIVGVFIRVRGQSTSNPFSNGGVTLPTGGTTPFSGNTRTLINTGTGNGGFLGKIWNVGSWLYDPTPSLGQIDLSEEIPADNVFNAFTDDYDATEISIVVGYSSGNSGLLGTVDVALLRIIP